jgi:hypothetical protein
VPKWKEQLNEKPYINKKGKLTSVYEVQCANGTSPIATLPLIVVLMNLPGPPTQKQAYEKLIQEEKIKRLADVQPLTGLAQFVNNGLNIAKDLWLAGTSRLKFFCARVLPKKSLIN